MLGMALGVAAQGAAAAATPAVGVLDELSAQPLGAWSVARRLKNAYAGSLIRIRRSSDDAELDIGFLANGDLDAAAAAAHIGGGSGFITTVYDQAGANNLIMTTTANQPAYAAAGFSGKPCGDLDGTSDHWTCHGLGASFSGLDMPLSVIMATKVDSFITTGHAFWALGRAASTTPIFGAVINTATTSYRVIRRDDGNGTAEVNSEGNLSVDTSFAVVFPGNNVSAYLGRNRLNNFNNASLNRNTITLDRFTFGALVSASASNFFDGKIAEAMVWSSAISDSDRLAVSDNQKTYYDLIPAGILQETTLQTLPDGGNGSDAGKGWTCTGLAFDQTLDSGAGGWWVGNDGRNILTDPSHSPSIISTNLTGTTILSQINTAPLFGAISIQGMAVDISDNTLWTATPQAEKIWHLTKAGVDLGGTLDVVDANGLTYDSIRDQLWYNIQGSDLVRRIAKDSTSIIQTIDTNLSDIDHLWHDLTRDWIWVMFGANDGIPGSSNAYDCTTGALKASFKMAECRAVECAVILNSTTLYATHDGYFHEEAPLFNQLQTYAVDLG